MTTLTDEMIEAAAKAIFSVIYIYDDWESSTQCRSLAFKAATAALPLLQQEWKDIESAPRDGTWFLIANKDDGPSSYFWFISRGVSPAIFPSRSASARQ